MVTSEIILVSMPDESVKNSKLIAFESLEKANDYLFERKVKTYIIQVVNLIRDNQETLYAQHFDEND